MAVIRVNRPIVITETVSLGIGGSFTSSVYLIDRLKTLTGYTQSFSSTATVVVNQSVNSAFTSAVSTSVVINSLGYSEPQSYAALPGRYVRYTVDAVNSATQIEFNLLGTTL